MLKDRGIRAMSEPEKEITAEETGNEESEEQSPDRPSDNPSVSRCIRAWNRAYRKKLHELDEDESDYEAKEAGKRYFLRAMPPLAGYQNITDFIACVTFAELAEIIRHSEAQNLFDAVKVALGALRQETKPLQKAIV
jgi:hypothetical protein